MAKRRNSMRHGNEGDFMPMDDFYMRRHGRPDEFIRNGIEQKIVESAIVFWFKDADCKAENKVVEYLGEY